MKTTTEQLKQIFEDCTLTHSGKGEYWLTTPDYPIEDYPKFKKMITDVGGVWKRKGFLFTSDPQRVLEQIFQQGIDWKKLTQFFPTPHPVCRKMVEKLPQGVEYWHGKRILEPSAGRGSILMEILLRTCFLKLAKNSVGEQKLDPTLQVLPQSQVDLCEIDEFNYLCLENKIPQKMGYNRVCRDFMHLPTDWKYDIILANPPFHKNQYALHLKKMVQHLSPGADIVCILPANAQHENLFDDLCDITFEPLSNGEFRSSGTTVNTVILSAKRKRELVLAPVFHKPAKRHKHEGQLTLFI
ncbi:hypothetical protein [Spirosoma sp.]|uniref:hypothetical protein n=1 Tax=Spirosoma sp. TaxID=1899569 RepID=UPI0026234E97|nr:hypothetical protein [Spirosoma sp.]MCX6217681.1 hypothetical protein [Spirosoma sp.]